MINGQEEFKQERAKALASGNVAQIRAWAKRYSVRLPVDDEEVLRLAALAPDWRD